MLKHGWEQSLAIKMYNGGTAGEDKSPGRVVMLV